MKGNMGIARLARHLQGQNQKAAASPPDIELGTIQSDMSLVTDGYPVPIPRSDYLIARSMSLPESITTEPGGSDSHTHQIKTPSEASPLAPGDRVLVAWANGGADAVVIDVII